MNLIINLNKLKFNFFVIFLFFVYLSSCTSTEPLEPTESSEQFKFIEKVKAFQYEFEKSKGNYKVEDIICANFDELIEGKTCANWNAVVKRVLTDGDNVRYLITDVDGIEFKLWPKDDETWSKIGNINFDKLSEGSEVSFSGTIVNETSITCNGKMTEPELEVEPTSISTTYEPN